MTESEKRKHLLQLSEDRLRREVLIPLLTAKGFHDPILHHHANEKGKDIVCKEYDEKFQKTRYIAVVVKKGDITGSSSDSNGLMTVLNQIKQAINEPYKHIYELREVGIDQVILVASGDIKPTALESVYGTLRSDRMDKAIRDTIDGAKLVRLIDESFPTYWDELFDERFSLVKQRNTLFNNLSKLLTALISDPVERCKALNKLAVDELDIGLFSMRNFARYMVDIGYREVRIEEIDPEFTLPYLTTGGASIRQAMFDIKKAAQEALMEVDLNVEPLRHILRETDPKKVLQYCDESDIGGDELKWGVQQYEKRRELLEQEQLSDLYFRVMDDLHATVQPAIILFWEKHPPSEHRWWLGYRVCYSAVGQRIVESAVYEREAEPRMLREAPFLTPHLETVNTFVDADGSLGVEIALNSYSSFREDKMSVDERAAYFMHNYEHALANAFFSTIGGEES